MVQVFASSLLSPLWTNASQSVIFLPNNYLMSLTKIAKYCSCQQLGSPKSSPLSINCHSHVYKQQDVLFGVSSILEFLKAKMSFPTLDEFQNPIPFHYACRYFLMFRFKALDYELCKFFMFFNTCVFVQT
jgi:hypothetical protein